jgi:hypothetical protein
MLHIFAGDLPHTVGCGLDPESLYIACWPVLCMHRLSDPSDNDALPIVVRILYTPASQQRHTNQAPY